MKILLLSAYKAESRFNGIFLIFSLVSLIIGCLGLFALVSYTVERRSKEIGIRKVLGASVGNILSMISAEFILLVALSCLVAIPLGYYFMNEWLTSFAYHISLNVFMFVCCWWACTGNSMVYRWCAHFQGSFRKSC